MAGHVSEVRLDTVTLGDFRPVMTAAGMCYALPEPATFPMCYGPEFAGRMLDQWAYLNKVELDFSRPGKPTANAYIEAFTSRLRQECLNASWFLSMADARARINDWKDDYNQSRPHSALRNFTPAQLADQLKSARKVA